MILLRLHFFTESNIQSWSYDISTKLWSITILFQNMYKNIKSNYIKKAFRLLHSLQKGKIMCDGPVMMR